jgi:2-C-methyl-D-erythritol 4-phosphate cytidylyltransferase/2-C-methyl-D-erythritol 2,4-cyclodiphosphate synthase
MNTPAERDRPSRSRPSEQPDPVAPRQLPPLHLIVLAGGRSARARRGDSTAPKQFRHAGRRMLFVVPVAELATLPEVATVTVVVPEAWRPVAEIVLDEAKLAVPVILAPAGEHRTASTVNALRALAEAREPGPKDLVAVHDAARPFATRHLLRRVAEAAARHGGAVPGVAVPDTIVQLTEGPVPEAAGAAYLERAALQAVQTPQVFIWESFLAAHVWCAEQELRFTDDGGLMAARGAPPVVVMGETDNWKVTTESDWQRAEALLRRE